MLRGGDALALKHCEGILEWNRIPFKCTTSGRVLFGDFLLRQKVTRCSRVATSETLLFVINNLWEIPLILPNVFGFIRAISDI